MWYSEVEVFIIFSCIINGTGISGRIISSNKSVDVPCAEGENGTVEEEDVRSYEK